MDYSLCEATITGDTQSLNEILQRDPLILDKFLAGCFHCKSPLHVATSNGQTLFIKELLRLKPKLAKVVDSQQQSALHLASDEGRLEIVKELVDVSPEMCLVTDRDGNNPLHVAAIKGNVSVLELLVQTNSLAARVKVDKNETILHLCVKHNQLESLELLLRMIKSQAFVNAKDNDGNNILHLAILEKRFPIARHVEMYGKVEVNEKNGSGFTAMDILFLEDFGSAQTNWDFIIDRLRQANAKRANDTLPGDWIIKGKDSLLVVATLMATISYQARVSPPGGIWQDDSNGHRAGEAVMAYNQADSYTWFLCLNTIGFAASFTMIGLLITSKLSTIASDVVTRLTLNTCMILAMASTTVTFSLSNATVTPQSARDENVKISLIVWGVAGLLNLLPLKSQWAAR